jgi:hypothetical protein
VIIGSSIASRVISRTCFRDLLELVFENYTEYILPRLLFNALCSVTR